MKKFIISFICGFLYIYSTQSAFANPQISNEITLCVEKGAIEAFSIERFDDWKHKLSLYTKIILFLEKTKLEVDQEIKFDYTNDCSHYYWYSRNCEFYHYSEDNYRKKFYIKFKHKIDSDSNLQIEINKLTNFGDKNQPKSVNAFFNRLKKIIEPSECDRLLKKDNTEEVEEEKKEQQRLAKEVEEKEKKIKEQQRLARELEEKEKKIKEQQRLIKIIIFVILIVLIVLVIFLLHKASILKKVKNKIINLFTVSSNDSTILNNAIVTREVINTPELSSQQHIKIKHDVTTSILTNQLWWTVGASVIGKSHLDNKPPLPCQDSHYLRNIDRAWGIAISCDGAGSAENSHFGSKFVAEKAAERFSKDIDKIRFKENSSWTTLSRNRKTKLPTHKEWHDLAKKIFAEILQDLEQYAKEKNIEVKSLACTVIVVIFSPKGLLVTHIGDGRGGYRNKNGEWKSFLTPFKGEEANQTIFITSPYIWKDLDKLESRIITEEVTAFTIMSDGCESYCFQTYMQDNKSEELRVVDVNKPHEGFFEPLYNNLCDVIANPEISPPEKIKEDWGNFLLSGKGFDTEPDDKTMIIGILKQGTQK